MTKQALVLVFALTACGDNRALELDAAPADAPPPSPRAVVVAGSFTPGDVGVMSSLDLGTMQLAQRVAPNGAIGSDPIVRRVDDELFVVNRADGNNVTVLDAKTFAVKEQLATGAGSNPQDVAVFGDKLFVPVFGGSGVVVLTRGSTTIDTIDLSNLDPDGEPNCISAFLVGTDVYVACELLDANFAPRGPGKVAVINASIQTIRTTLTLANANPFGVFEQMPELAGGHLVIPTVPNFGDFSVGCIEKITPGETPVVSGCVVANQAIAGYAARVDFQLVDASAIMWMVVSKFDTEARGNLQGHDLLTDCLWPEPISPPTQVLVDMAICPNDTVVVADQTMAANGLRVYVGGIETTTTPLAIGLKPGSSHGLTCY